MLMGKVQTVFVEDLGSCRVASFVDGDVPNGTECDLVEERVHSLKELIVSSSGNGLGFSLLVLLFIFLIGLSGFTSSVANLLGRLGMALSAS